MSDAIDYGILHGQLRDSIADLRAHLSRNRGRDMPYVLLMLDSVISDGAERARRATLTGEPK